MIGRFQRGFIGRCGFVFSVLFILAILVTLSSPLSCVTMGPPFVSGIEGPWFFSANNLPGRLEFRRAGYVWTGQIHFNNTGRWEELTDIFFDHHTGQVQFRRPHGNQVYAGTLSGNRIVGAFGIGSPVGFPWEAWRQ